MKAMQLNCTDIELYQHRHFNPTVHMHVCHVYTQRVLVTNQGLFGKEEQSKDYHCSNVVCNLDHALD